MKRALFVLAIVLLAAAAGYAARGPTRVVDEPAIQVEVPATWGPLVAYNVNDSIGYAVFVDSDQTIRVIGVGGKAVFAKITRVP